MLASKKKSPGVIGVLQLPGLIQDVVPAKATFIQLQKDFESNALAEQELFYQNFNHRSTTACVNQLTGAKSAH